MKKITSMSLIWIMATIIEWASIILFIAAMGYDYIDFSMFNKLKNWEHINMAFYICSGIDILLFWILMHINKKARNMKDMLIALYCCLVQFLLLIYKVKW